ncbi:MAG: Gfo/Idh/MocA family oxidoreductase [Lentisphaeria bacterium]|nr:Gfo/Idh/MocA family oxidoreductase [Lentisphaeria bacterium]
MKPYEIALIGAGQLGSRHLQGLAKITQDCRITVVEPSSEAMARTKARYAECPANPKIQKIDFVSGIDLLPSALDFVIVATSSMVRRKIVEDLLVHSRVKYLLLEKFLFPRIQDYAAVDELLKRHNVQTFVNCPRRLFAYYRRVAELLAGQKFLSIRVSGSNWGLGCNAIHFLDIITYLVNSADFTLENHLEPVVLDSKRPGYVEFAGSICGRFSGGTKFEIASYVAGKAPILIELQAESANVIISESSGKMMYADEAHQWQWQEEEIQVLYQSGLSGIVADEFLTKGTSQLVPFDWSAKCHVKLLQLFLDHQRTIKPKEDKELCPIT